MPSPAYATPQQPHATIAAEKPPPPREPGNPRAPRLRRHHLWIILVVALALIVALVAHAFDGYLRRTLEAKINQDLHGYHVTLGHAHLSPFGLGLTLRDVVIRQDANPEPPVAAIPRLKMSVEWSAVLTGHLVADAVFFRPQVHVNLPQLEVEAKDTTKLKDRGWQQAFESIYPLKFNLMQVRDGDLVYIDQDPKWPLHISHWNAAASNIRNIQSHAGTYPSPVHTEGVVFDTGRATLDGHADFLSVPYPGVHAFYKAQNIPLDRLRPFGERANLTLTGGALSSRGEVEYSPRHREARIADVVVNRLHLDYTHTVATAPEEKARGKKVEKAVKTAEQGMPVEIARLSLTDSDVGVIAPIKDGRFRFFVDRANLDVTNLSSGFRQGPAKATLTGRFLGSGTARGSSTFRDGDAKGPDFNLLLAVDKASLPKINDLLRAYGKFDVAAGTFSVYSEVKVRNDRIDGYVKPLFQDIQVYDPKQDKNKPVLKKLYEKVVGSVAHVLENHKNEQVATVADLSGPLSAPNTSSWEIFVRLVSNAFVKAILPGFQREYQAAHGGK
ncbi:MAG TPA: DUF748 domain-containing protein [Thermoanaerobaculia bacterium]|jgi:hypothetical protein|nr:DUF748 domain-containing protein [Thermoanaerobaculia bacterium]